MSPSKGPLDGVRVVELAGLGAVPFAGMMLSDQGAQVIRVDRPGAGPDQAEKDVLSRGRRSVTIDLKKPAGVETLLRLADQADVLLEGFRPGVAERLGFGPDVCRERNHRLVYARMTGWGQQGPLASAPGHDLNYLALTGVLGWIQSGRVELVPTLPGLISDLAGGGLMLAYGVTAALVQRSVSGLGQVIDAAMVDGAASLSAMVFAKLAQGYRMDAQGSDFFDGSSPFYGLYETADGQFMAVAAVEAQFYVELLRALDLEPTVLPDRADRANWPQLREQIAAVFRSRSQAQWTAVFDGVDACVSPVLDFAAAAEHPHAVARQSFVTEYGVLQPAPAPRFSDTPGGIAGPPCAPGSHSREALLGWGWSDDEIAQLRRSGAVG